MNPALVAAFKPSLPESEFLKIFPRPYCVEAVDIYDAQRLGLHIDRSFWRFEKAFEYIDPIWGSILIPEGFITDFASIPPQLRNIIDDDSPIMLYPSAPHDFLFTQRPDGTRGWLQDGRQLSLEETNNVLTEAMAMCGANALTRDVVFAAVQLANQPIKGTFRT